jgi:hypothetical protein|tara:strand:+ start:7429 stop:7785 length:357 start_codon:yes stop_codon:yes gene_type:complete
MALYSDHATSEQFHSEFKMERLPSGKFDTNNLVMAFATMGYHVLRWMGLRLTGPDAPVRHRAKRRRLRTVMQEIMTVACRLVHSGRQWIIWPTLSGLYGVPRPLSGPCFLRIKPTSKL